MAISMRRLADVAQIMEPIKSTVINHLNHRGTMMTSLNAIYPSKPRALTMSVTFTLDSSQTLKKKRQAVQTHFNLVVSSINQQKFLPILRYSYCFLDIIAVGDKGRRLKWQSDPLNLLVGVQSTLPPPWC